MADRKPLTDDEGEVRELTDEDFARAVPFSKLPAELQAILSDPVRKIVPDADGDDSKPLLSKTTFRAAWWRCG